MWLAVLTCKWDGVIILNSWPLPFFVYFTSAYIHTHIYIHLICILQLKYNIIVGSYANLGGHVFGKQITTTTTTLLFVQKYKSWMVHPANNWKATRGGARQVHV